MSRTRGGRALAVVFTALVVLLATAGFSANGTTPPVASSAHATHPRPERARSIAARAVPADAVVVETSLRARGAEPRNPAPWISVGIAAVVAATLWTGVRRRRAASSGPVRAQLRPRGPPLLLPV